MSALLADVERTPEQARALEDLHYELREEAARLAEAGKCGCTCGGDLKPNRHARQRYLGGHRARAHDRRLRLEAEALGVDLTTSLRVSLKTLRAVASLGDRHPDAEKPRKAPQTKRRRAPRPGLSVYFPDPAVASALLDVLEAPNLFWHADGDLDEATSALRAALDRRRKRAAA